VALLRLPLTPAQAQADGQIDLVTGPSRSSRPGRSSYRNYGGNFRQTQ